jgi:hypothetical protein
MKKIFILSVIASGLIADTFTNPLPLSFRAVDNGGTLQAIDAYKDGVGAELIDKPGVATDNSAMNTLVLKYGEAAKANNVTIVDQVVYGTSPVATQTEKSLAGNLTVNGAACNDGNQLTVGESWINGLCTGGLIPNGTSCDDSNTETINDIYNNQICVGVIPKSCNEIKQFNNLSASGNYTLSPDASLINKYTTYCEMVINGGGWTLVNKLTKPNGVYNTACTTWSNDIFATCNAVALNDPTSTWSISLPAGNYMYLFKQKNNSATPCNSSLPVSFRIDSTTYNTNVTNILSTEFKDISYASSGTRTFSFSTNNGGYTAGVCDDNGYVSDIGIYIK